MIKSRQIDDEAIKECAVITQEYNELLRRWTLPVIHGLSTKNPARFNELKRIIPNISSSSLAERLTELEKHGIIERTVHPDNPPRVEYTFTEKGMELKEVLKSLEDWILRWKEYERKRE